MPTRELPHYWTPEPVRQILAAMSAGQPWLFTLLIYRSALRQAEALDLQWRDLNFAAAAPTITATKDTSGRSSVVPAHSALVDIFWSVPKGRADARVFQFSDRTAAKWITPGIAAAGLVTLTTGTGVKGPATASASGCKAA